MASEGLIPSTTALFKIGKQSAKGTPAATGFICATATSSYLRPRIDRVTRDPEHGCNVSTGRVTAKRSPTRRNGYVAAGGLTMAAYPRAIPRLLQSLGFTIATTNNTTHYTHVATLAVRPNWPWMTLLRTLGSKELRATDVRASQVTFNAANDNQGARFEATFMGLELDDAAGTETHTAESIYELLPVAGNIDVLVDPGGADLQVAQYGGAQVARAVTMTFDNPLDEEQRALFQLKRADMPPTGFSVNGAVNGVDIDYDLYEQIYNGGVGETDISALTALMSYDVQFESPENIPGAAVPFSMRVQVPDTEVLLSDDSFNASGNNTVAWSFEYEMVDMSTTPITVTVVNDHASY